MSLSHRSQARSRLMKERDYHDELKNELESGGLNVNIRPSTVLEYPADVPGSRLSGFLAIACPCTWRWAAVRDAFDFYLYDSMANIRSIWYQSVFLPHNDKMGIVTPRLDQPFLAQVVGSAAPRCEKCRR